MVAPELIAMLFEAEKLFSDLRNKKDVSRERIDPFITKAKSNPKRNQGCES